MGAGRKEESGSEIKGLNLDAALADGICSFLGQFIVDDPTKLPSRKAVLEAIAIDNEMGFVYYSDEQVGIRKYYADPAKNNNNELAFFGQNDFKSDNEGIAIYKKTDKTGYILVSNQQANTFVVYPREGSKNNKNAHYKIAEFPTSTIECDGADATTDNRWNIWLSQQASGDECRVAAA